MTSTSHTVSRASSLEPMFSLVPVSMIVVDENGAIVRANDQATELLGWERDEFAGLKLETLIPDRFRAAQAEHFAHYLKAPESLDTGLEIWALRKDGSELPVDIALRPWSRNGSTVSVATIRDLSQATRQAAVNAAVLDSITSHVAVLDRDGQIVAVNAAWREFAKANGSAGEVGVGADYLEVCRRAVRDEPLAGEALEGIRAILDGPSEEFRMKYACHSPSEDRWYTMSAVPLSSPCGGAVVAHTSVTELVLRERELRQALAEVESRKDHLTEENVYLRGELHDGMVFGDIVGNSEPWRHVLAQTRLVAGTHSTVLISGETGTGKELLAWVVHRESNRRDRPLITVNCAVLPSTLIESELFGHERGAFSGADRLRKGRFERADGGTLFLDEIGELPLDLQAKLLKVLETGQFERLGSSKTQRSDVRVVAATNRDLADEVRAGRFRSDLYYRLMVFPIQVPPLRERRRDIRLLAMYFLAQQNARQGKSIEAIPESAMAAMEAYDWPGNVRELKNLIERAAILSPGKTLQLETSTLQQGAAVQRQGSRLPAPGPAARAASASLEDVERAHIMAVLESCDWTVKGRGNAAEQLDLKESSLRSRMKRLGIARRVVYSCPRH